jgi:hypothetical protein
MCCSPTGRSRGRQAHGYGDWYITVSAMAILLVFGRVRDCVSRTSTAEVLTVIVKAWPSTGLSCRKLSGSSCFDTPIRYVIIDLNTADVPPYWGPRGRGFKSRLPDQPNPAGTADATRFFMPVRDPSASGHGGLDK